jgi:hypothetical protein
MNINEHSSVQCLERPQVSHTDMNGFRVDVAIMIIVADLPDGPCRAKYDATYVVVLYRVLWESTRADEAAEACGKEACAGFPTILRQPWTTGRIHVHEVALLVAWS